MKATALIKSDEQALLSAESVFSLYSKFCHYKSTIVASVSGCLENSDLENSDLRPQTSKTQTSKTQTSKTQTSRTQTSKTQTSKTQTSKTQYTFDENSRSTVLIFPTVFDYWRADFAFFCRFMFIYIYCWTGNKNKQSNCRSRSYDCVMECLSL